MDILITGASSGIGEALALKYAKNNNIYIVSSNIDKLNLVSQSIIENGGTCTIFDIDLSNFNEINRLKKIKKLDLIILNAGISLGHNNNWTTFEEFKRLFDINFLANHKILDTILHTIKNKNKKTKIVFISSLASIITMPTSTAYSSSKRAINSYVEGIRNSLHIYNVEVINILPGFIDTPLTKKNNFKMPFFMPLNKGVERIVYAINKSRKEYAYPKRFFFIIKLISLFPTSLRDVIIRYLNFNRR